MAVDAGTIYSDVRIQLDKLKGDINKVTAQYDKMGSDIKRSTGEAATQSKKSFGEINLAGVAAFAGISIAIKKSITSFTNFEQSLANVQSVARATPEEFRALEEAAAAAGESTRFSASQAADALYALASAGLNATESTEALAGVLDLAAATQSDLAFTAQTVTAAISQFGLEAKESSRVANTFSAAIANSQANMEKLSAAFRQVGPVAGTLGISLEETTGALQALFNAGFRGEQAGTVLRNVLSQLADTTGPVSTKLAALGVNLEKINPATNSLIDVLGTLADANLSTGEAINAFGTEAGPGLLTLLAEGRAGLQRYTDAVTGTNSAAEAAAIQMDTVQGSLDQLKSVTEAVSISFVKEFEPALRKAVDILTALLRGVNSLPGPVKVFLGVFTLGIPIIIGATTAVTALGGAFAFLLGPVGLVLASVAGVVAAISGISKAVKNARINKITEEFGALAEEIDVSIERMDELVKTAEKLGAKDKDVENLVKEINKLQRELGLSDEEMNALIETAEYLGATNENVSQVVREVAVLKNELGLADKEIEAISDALLRGSWGGEFADAAFQVGELAKNTGLTEKQIIAIGLANKNITTEYRTQLEQLQQAQELSDARKQDEEDILNLKKQQRNALKEQIDAERKAIEEAELQAEAAKIAEVERVSEVSARRRAAENIRRESIAVTNRLVNAGAITQEEAIDRTIAAYKREIETLAEIGYTGELVEREWLGANGELVRGIQAGDTAMNEAISTIAELIERQKELGEVSIESGDEEEKRQKRLNDMSDEYRDKIDALIMTEDELIEKERTRAIQAAEGNRELISLINEYYDALKNAEREIILFGDTTSEEFANSLASIENMAEGFVNLVSVMTTGEIQDVLSEISSMTKEAAKLAESAGAAEVAAVLGVISAVAAVTSAVIDFFDLRGERAEAYYQQLEALEADILQQQLSNRKKALDYEYQETLSHIERVKDARIDGIRSTLSEETELFLIELGIIEGSYAQTYESIYNNILEQAAQSGKILTEGEKKRIKEILDAEMEAAQKKEEAEKQYKQAMAQWDYDKAVADKQAAVMTARINKERALSELSWWDVHIKNRDDDVRDMFNTLISQIQSAPLPPVPTFQTGGIVPGSSYTGDRVIARVNSGEGIFTPEQMEALGMMINGGGKGKGMTLILEIDGRQIAQNTVEYVDNGKVRFKVLGR